MMLILLSSEATHENTEALFNEGQLVKEKDKEQTQKMIQDKHFFIFFENVKGCSVFSEC